MMMCDNHQIIIIIMTVVLILILITILLHIDSNLGNIRVQQSLIPAPPPLSLSSICCPLQEKSRTTAPGRAAPGALPAPTS